MLTKRKNRPLDTVPLTLTPGSPTPSGVAIYGMISDTLEDYVAAAIERAESQKEYFTGPLGNDVFQFSPLPWVSYTHISHTNSGKKDNATPLFDWGKYFIRDGKFILPFSVQVHHSFVDGIHIGKLADSLQTYLNRF